MAPAAVVSRMEGRSVTVQGPEAAPPARYSLVQVMAARVVRERATRPGSRLTGPADLARWGFAYYGATNDDREAVVALCLDGAHRLQAVVEVTRGTANLAMVHPRDVFRPALLLSAGVAVVLLHNHPGGDPAPSDQDRTLTRSMVLAGEAIGVKLLDHVICGDGRYYSFAEARQL